MVESTPAGCARDYTMTPNIATPLDQPLVDSRRSSHVYRMGETISKRESRSTEFKTGGGSYTTTVLREHINKYGSAFLNSGGGRLLVGVEDNGVVVGIHATGKRRADIRQLIEEEFTRFTPPVDKDLYTVEFLPINRDYFYILEVLVKPGIEEEIYADGDNKVYLRRDGSVQGPLWPRAIRDMVISKFIKKNSS